MEREAHEKRAVILTILAKSPRAKELWQIWERGYVLVIVILVRTTLLTTSTFHVVHGIWPRIVTS